MKVMGPHFSEGKCDIVACADCGFVFNSYENADQRSFDEYYLSTSRTMNYYEMYAKETADSYFLHLLDAIRDYVTKDSRILDIAGGYGELAQLLVRSGYQDVTVLELKPECAQAVRDAGIAAIEGNLLQLEKADGLYDMVICSHTLEHFIDVDTAILKMKELVKPDGYLYIEVPDMYMYGELDRAPYHFLTYEHVCHFSEVTIQNIAAQFGFQIAFLKKYVKCNDYPCLYAMLRPANRASELSRDQDGAPQIFEYIKQCEEKIAAAVSRFERTQQPLILWGIGASTAQLLNHGFDKCNVVQLVDSNPARQELRFEIGSRVLYVEDPSEMRNTDAAIFILPTAYKANIEKNIRSYGYLNDVVSL